MSEASPEQVQVGGGENTNQTPHSESANDGGKATSDSSTKIRSTTRRDNRPSITVSAMQKVLKVQRRRSVQFSHYAPKMSR